MKRLFGSLILGAALAVGAEAQADPTRWARARDPVLDQRETMLAAAEALVLKYQRALFRQRDEEGSEIIAQLYLHQAKELLEQGGAARATDPSVRYRLAEIYHQLQDDKRAAPLLVSVVRDGATPDAIRADAYASLAISYARLGRHEDEITAYGEALKLEPHSRPRSTLLANRAEAYMALGDITAAVEGYRAALSLLTAVDLIFRSGATTLWGLAVALDRSGDLDSGLEAVQLARTYDKNDHGINGTGWFFVPPYDRFYYHALGHWSAARSAEVGAARAEAFGQAIANWEEYLASAPPDGKWVPVARARLRQCEKERDAFLRAARQKTERPAGGATESQAPKR